MKKKYEKPRVYMEQFTLAEHIAGCNLDLKNAIEESCTASGTIGSANSDGWFLEGGTVCTVPVYDYCYTNGTTNIATINS